MNDQRPTKTDCVFALLVLACILGPPLFALKPCLMENFRGLAVGQSTPIGPAASNTGERALDLLIGAVLGMFASVVAAIIYDRWTRPLLVIDIPGGPPARGQTPGAARHEFFHVRVRNRPATWPLSGRKPAWLCQAIIEVVTDDGARTVLEPISARWTSLPEPVLPVGLGGGIVQIPDVAQMLTGRRVDVHNHEDQMLVIALKFEGDDGCFLFSNESYAFPNGSRPEWRLAMGRHRLRIALHYDRGREVTDFWLENNGPRLDDVRLRPLP